MCTWISGRHHRLARKSRHVLQLSQYQYDLMNLMQLPPVWLRNSKRIKRFRSPQVRLCASSMHDGLRHLNHPWFRERERHDACGDWADHRHMMVYDGILRNMIYVIIFIPSQLLEALLRGFHHLLPYKCSSVLFWQVFGHLWSWGVLK